MVRKKNALTEYHIAAIPENGGVPEYYRLAKWIQTVNDDSNEETETTGFYDGDGTPNTDVISVAKSYSFEGFFDEEDPAHQLIASLEFETGDARKIMFKQVRTNGDVFEGVATVSNIVVTGGEATEYATFSCTITWDKKPEKVTP